MKVSFKHVPNKNTPLVVLVTIPDGQFREAQYTLRVLSQIWGIPIQIVRTSPDRGPDVVYGPRNDSDNGHGTLYIPFDPECYDSSVPFKQTELRGFQLWTNTRRTDTPDLIGGAFRLLTLLDERQVPVESRDRRGIFTIEKLPRPRRESTTIPFVDNHAEYLFSEMKTRKNGLEHARIERWPHGKKYAVVLTHDTDAVHVGAPKELLYNFSKFVMRRNTTHLRMFQEGLKYLGRPLQNPLFGFPVWAKYEAGRDVRSCFFLFTKPKGVGFDINDCRSTVENQKINWTLLRQLHDEGWEFGWHAPIKAKQDINYFLEAKRNLEEILQAPIRGLRHHYWALDWSQPYRTLRMHVNAGFRYDTSLAFRDSPGLRSGISLPYTPFDPERKKPLAIYELPTAIMDGHIIRDRTQMKMAITKGQNVMEKIRNVGGMALLDWHTETACDRLEYQNYLAIFKGVLDEYLEDSDAWIATPWEVVQHWHRRSLNLAQMR